MASLESVRQRIKECLRDTDLRKPSRDTPEYDNAIAEAYLGLASRLPAATSVTTSAGTIAANADTFTLPTASGEEYGGEVRIRLRSDGSFLRRRTVMEIDLLRSGDISTVGTSRPTDFCMWEEGDQDVQCRCWPRSRELETYDLHRSLLPSDLRDAAALDTDDINFSRYGLVALVYHASALILKSMTDEDLTARRLNRGVADHWLAQADIVLYKEAERRHNIESVGYMMKLVS